jgi:hypothetical protein
MANNVKKRPARLDFEADFEGAADGDMTTKKAIESPYTNTKGRG